VLLKWPGGGLLRKGGFQANLQPYNLLVASRSAPATRGWIWAARFMAKVKQGKSAAQGGRSCASSVALLTAKE